jgi:hypothetical protein
MMIKCVGMTPFFRFTNVSDQGTDGSFFEGLLGQEQWHTKGEDMLQLEMKGDRTSSGTQVFATLLKVVDCGWVSKTYLQHCVRLYVIVLYVTK